MRRTWTCHGGLRTDTIASENERLLAQVLDPTERESSKLATRPKTITHWNRVSRHFGMFTTQASLDERGNRHEIQATDAGPNSFSNSKDHCSAKIEPRSGIGPATVLLSSLSTRAQRLHEREIQSTACLLSSEPATRTGSGIAGLSHLRARSHKTCFEQGGNNQALGGNFFETRFERQMMKKRSGVNRKICKGECNHVR